MKHANSNALLKHTQTLELLMAEIQSMLASNHTVLSEKQAGSVSRAPKTDIQLPNDAIPVREVNGTTHCKPGNLTRK